MAKVVVLSMAYRGDVHPYVPVASELVRRGHDVTFVVPREFHPGFADEPFDCVHSGSDFGPTDLNEHGEWLAKWGMRFGGTRLLELYFGHFTIPHLDAMYEAVHAALDGADLLFSHPAAASVGAIAAEQRDIPWISGDLFPMLVPTETASVIPGVPTMGRRMNRLSWRIARSTRPNRLTCARDFARFRRRIGVDDTVRSPLDMRISRHLNLAMASPHYVTPAFDWPDNYRMTGFTHWENRHANMPGDVSEFLDAGDPPVLITLGTLAAAVHPERFRRAVEAVDRAGRRSLSLCSTVANATALQSGIDPHRNLTVAFAPLARVLPHVCAVVHSGSHGTNSMSLAAGLPSVIMPSIFDQVWHARRQEELGTGIHCPKGRGLDEAVRHVRDDEQMHRRATEFGRLLEAEDGTAATADAIETFLSQR